MINTSLIPKAYVEILEILKYFPKDEYNKIPSILIEKMKINMDKEYKYEIKNIDNFQEQEMLKETETILAILYRDYLANEEQKNMFFIKEREKVKLLEEEKRKKYNIDDLFKQSKKEVEKEIQVDNIKLIDYNKSFSQKIINIIKNFFK